VAKLLRSFGIISVGFFFFFEFLKSFPAKIPVLMLFHIQLLEQVNADKQRPIKRVESKKRKAEAEAEAEEDSPPPAKKAKKSEHSPKPKPKAKAKAKANVNASASATAPLQYTIKLTTGDPGGSFLGISSIFTSLTLTFCFPCLPFLSFGGCGA